MPPKGKQKNANQHDKRNDTGLAPPGKRVDKQRSNPNINGHANGHAVLPAPPPPLPSTGLNQGLTFPRPATTASTETATSASSETTTPLTEHIAQDTTLTHAALDKTAPGDMANNTVDAGSSEPKSDPDNSTLKAIANHVGSSFGFAATILTSCPLRDAIAILILLLSLPPTLVITIHTLFAFLTFVPPTSAITWSSWKSSTLFSDLTTATAGGGPSPAVILFCDVAMVLLYHAPPMYIQNVLLDLGQAVIAVSLSGAAAGKAGSSTNSILFCSAIVAVTHLFRYRGIHVTGWAYLCSTLNGMGLTTSWEPSVAAAPYPLAPTSYGKTRLLIGCHILAQGILTLVRKWFAGVSQSRGGKRQDPEAASLAEGVKPFPSIGEGAQDNVSTSSTDGRPPGPPPASRDSKERVSTSKKKRKQGNEARSQQPLWAAIASTKVTFLKELEQKQASNDALEVGVTNTTTVTTTTKKTSSLANNFSSQDRIWITDIRSTEITFRADISALTSSQEGAKPEDGPLVSAGIDKSKPFFVRLNGADWGSTRIFSATSRPTDNEEAPGEPQDQRSWSGEIYGLTPLTNYSCEIVRLVDQAILCTISLVTLSAPNTEQSSAGPAAPQPQSLRPLSPISTLKQSIAAAELKRDDARQKLKRTRKDHKNAASAVRKEIESLNSKVQSSGGQDERQKQRILQLKQHAKTAEEATIALKAETESLGEIPEEDVAASTAKKQAWQVASDTSTAAIVDYEDAKAAGNSEMSQLNAELATSAQKRERLMTRRMKLMEQHDRLQNEQHANLSARQRYDQERARVRQERESHEAQMLYWIQNSEIEAENLNIKANQLFQEADYANTQLARQHGAMSRPATPEGDLPGTNAASNRPTVSFDFPVFNFAPQQNQGSNLGNQGRARSSSMLSGYSGFTDDLDPMPSVPGGVYGGVPRGILEQERKHSESSSGSGGSVMGQMSPGPAKHMGPIGPPSAAEDKAKGKARMSPIGSMR